MKLLFYLFIYLLTLLNLYSNNILHIKFQDTISPATTKYFDDSLIKAKELNVKIILIELDTPGGLISSTREIVLKILNSEIPIVMFVSPKGARASSAGTFLMYASHLNAMAPGTNIGAATPVSIIGNGNPVNIKNKKDKTEDTIHKKIINDTAAYLKSIAEYKNRNIQWAVEAVKFGKSISSNEAYEIKVIDYLANDISDLLVKINKQKVKVNNKNIVINTTNSNIILYETTWKTKFLITISNPNISYIFLILAIYGIFFEMLNPGSIFPGIIGTISALIALYSLNILPFNYIGLTLIFLGVAFMLVEITISGLGILGIAGVISFIFGSLILFDEKTLGLSISYPLIIAISFVSISFFGYLISYLYRTKEKKSTIGIENLIGKKAIVVSISNEKQKVQYNGELWNIRSTDKLNLNEEVIIDNVDGLILDVRSLK